MPLYRQFSGHSLRFTLRIVPRSTATSISGSKPLGFMCFDWCLWRITGNAQFLGVSLLARMLRCAISSSSSSMSSLRSFDFWGRNAFCRRRVCSYQATTPDSQSFAAAITQPALFRSLGCRLVCSPDSTRPSDPFSSRSQTFDSLEPPPNSQESKVSPAVLIKTKAQARPKGTVQRIH